MHSTLCLEQEAHGVLLAAQAILREKRRIPPHGLVVSGDLEKAYMPPFSGKGEWKVTLQQIEQKVDRYFVVEQWANSLLEGSGTIFVLAADRIRQLIVLQEFLRDHDSFRFMEPMRRLLGGNRIEFGSGA